MRYRKPALCNHADLHQILNLHFFFSNLVAPLRCPWHCVLRDSLTISAALLGVANVRFLATVTIACAKRTDTAASVERKRRESARAISLE